MLKPKMMLILLMIIAPWCAQGQTKEDVNRIGKNGDRYTAAPDFSVSDWSVFGDQTEYKDDEGIDGWGLSTAGELGLTKGWNEFPNGKSVLVVLNPNIRMRHNGEQYYLDDCQVLRDGKWVAYKNRFKPVEPPTPPARAEVPPTIVFVTAPAQKFAVCKLSGTFDTVYVGQALNGTGKFTYSEELEVNIDKVDGLDTLQVLNAAVGTWSIQYTVDGPNGSMVCPEKFDVFDRLTVAKVDLHIKAPNRGFCSWQYGWKEFHKGLVYPFACEPGQTTSVGALGAAGGFGLSRIHGGGPKPQAPVTPGKTQTPINSGK